MSLPSGCDGRGEILWLVITDPQPQRARESARNALTVLSTYLCVRLSCDGLCVAHQYMQVGVCLDSIKRDLAVVGTTNAWVMYTNLSGGSFYVRGAPVYFQSDDESSGGLGMVMVL